jgi:hypothetical protein
MNNDNLIIRKSEFNNLNIYKEIFSLCFHLDVTESYFEWKFLKNPSGKAIAFEAYDIQKNRVAAFYGVIPEDYIINNKREIIYQSMDTMTHPEYRKKGLFVKLANITYEYVSSLNNGAVFFGIGGPNSMHGFINNLKWNNPIQIRYTFIPNLVLKYLLFPTKINIICKEIDEFNNESEMFLSTYNNINTIIYKYLDSNILNWRFSDNKIKSYKKYNIFLDNSCVGIAILEFDNIKKLIRIILYKDSDLSGKIQRQFLKYISKNYIDYTLYTWSDPNLIYKTNKKYFLKNPFKTGYFSYRVPFITLSKGNTNYTELIKECKNFDLYPGIQD